MLVNHCSIHYSLNSNQVGYKRCPTVEMCLFSYPDACLFCFSVECRWKCVVYWVWHSHLKESLVPLNWMQPLTPLHWIWHVRQLHFSFRIPCLPNVSGIVEISVKSSVVPMGLDSLCFLWVLLELRSYFHPNIATAALLILTRFLKATMNPVGAGCRGAPVSM